MARQDRGSSDQASPAQRLEGQNPAAAAQLPCLQPARQKPASAGVEVARALARALVPAAVFRGKEQGPAKKAQDQAPIQTRAPVSRLIQAPAERDAGLPARLRFPASRCRAETRSLYRVLVRPETMPLPARDTLPQRATSDRASRFKQRGPRAVRSVTTDC